MYNDKDFNPDTAGVMEAGSVEYDAGQAAVEIDKLIAMLQEMKDDGLETVLMASGNYRGAQWQTLGAGWCRLDEA